MPKDSLFDNHLSQIMQTGNVRYFSDGCSWQIMDPAWQYAADAGGTLRYSFTSIDAPGQHVITQAFAMNNLDEVVGGYGLPFVDSRAFIYSAGVLTPIGPAGEFSAAYGVNDAGDVVGYAGVHGFIYHHGALSLFDAPNATRTLARDINNRGEIVGTYEDDDSRSHGYIAYGDTVTALEGPEGSTIRPRSINDQGNVAGSYDEAGRSHGFLIHDGEFQTIDPPGATFVEIAAINNKNEVAGDYSDATGNHGFIFDGLNFTSFDAPGPSLTYVFGLNNRGEVVGNGGGHGFLYYNGIMSTLDMPGANNSSPSAINDRGQIIGYYSLGSELIHGFLATPQGDDRECVPMLPTCNPLGQDVLDHVRHGLFADLVPQVATAVTDALWTADCPVTSDPSPPGGGWSLGWPGAPHFLSVPTTAT